MNETTAQHVEEHVEAWPRVLFVCTGLIRTSENPNKLLVELYKLDELEQPVRERPFLFENNKRTRGLRLGGVYSIEAKIEADRHFIRPGTATFVRAWDNVEEVAGWRLRQDGAKNALKLTQQERKLTERHEQLKVLEPLQRAWSRSDRLGRRALEVAVIAFLRGEKPL